MFEADETHSGNKINSHDSCRHHHHWLGIEFQNTVQGFDKFRFTVYVQILLLNLWRAGLEAESHFRVPLPDQRTFRKIYRHDHVGSLSRSCKEWTKPRKLHCPHILYIQKVRILGNETAFIHSRTHSKTAWPCNSNDMLLATRNRTCRLGKHVTNLS